MISHIYNITDGAYILFGLSMWRKASHDQTFKISKPVKISLE